MANCKICDDEGWVCESHPDRPWNTSERGCECGPGMPCRICNPCDRNNPPRMSPGFVEIDPEDDAPSEPDLQGE